MKYTLTYCGNRGGKHVIKNVESFQHGMPGEILYVKTDKYGVHRFYGVPAHVILSIVDSDGNTLYDWEKDHRNAKTRYVASVHIAQCLARYGLSL